MTDQEVQPRWEFRVAFDAYTDEMAKAALEGLSEGVVRANMVWLNVIGEEAPCCLGQAGIRYVQPKGCGLEFPCQTVLGAAEIFAQQEATCIDIACYVAALLRLRGVAARVVFINMINQQNEPIIGMYHALVETDGGIHDYTQDLIDGKNVQCSADCRRKPAATVPIPAFDPRNYLPA